MSRPRKPAWKGGLERSDVLSYPSGYPKIFEKKNEVHQTPTTFLEIVSLYSFSRNCIHTIRITNFDKLIN